MHTIQQFKTQSTKQRLLGINIPLFTKVHSAEQATVAESIYLKLLKQSMDKGSSVLTALSKYLLLVFLPKSQKQ